MFLTHFFARRPVQRPLPQRARQIVVIGGNYRDIAELLLPGLLTFCLIGRVCLGGGFGERSKAKQRQKDASQDDKQPD